jgi:dTMP kinase
MGTPPPPSSGTETKPCFIVFEGIDGAGKSTQAKLLARRLSDLGIPVLLTAEPSDGPAGQIIRSLTTRLEAEEEARLFTEDRRDHVDRVILPSLAEERTVICDRYVYSSVAYQGARGVDQAAILAAQRAFAPQPDVIFLLEIPADIALARIGSARRGGFSTFEVREDLEAVDAVYRSINDPAIKRIDGTSSSENIHSIIMACLRELGCCNRAEHVVSAGEVVSNEC